MTGCSGDHRGFSFRVQRVDDALVGIEGFVGQQSIGRRNLWQQRIGPLQIVGLAWRQKEGERIAQRIDKRMDFGTQSRYYGANATGLNARCFLSEARCESGRHGPH
jgi:hypothetical protein